MTMNTQKCKSKKVASKLRVTVSCIGCDQKIDVDSNFCKLCGSKQESRSLGIEEEYLFLDDIDRCGFHYKHHCTLHLGICFGKRDNGEEIAEENKIAAKNPGSFWVLTSSFQPEWQISYHPRIDDYYRSGGSKYTYRLQEAHRFPTRETAEKFLEDEVSKSWEEDSEFSENENFDIMLVTPKMLEPKRVKLASYR